MFFKKRYFRIPRISNKIFYLFNLFFNFNNFFFEFLSFLGISKLFLNFFSFIKINNNFLKIFSLTENIFKNFGYVYSCLFNLIKGLFFKYEKSLFLFGLGFKVLLKSKNLHFYLSYSHPIIYRIPPDIDVKVSLNEIILKCINKQRLGEICLYLRNFKKPDVYKGKGIRYFNENINLKLIKKK